MDYISFFEMRGSHPLSLGRADLDRIMKYQTMESEIDLSWLEFRRYSFLTFADLNHARRAPADAFGRGVCRPGVHPQPAAVRHPVLAPALLLPGERTELRRFGGICCKADLVDLQIA